MQNGLFGIITTLFKNLQTGKIYIYIYAKEGTTSKY